MKAFTFIITTSWNTSNRNFEQHRDKNEKCKKGFQTRGSDLQIWNPTKGIKTAMAPIGSPRRDTVQVSPNAENLCLEMLNADGFYHNLDISWQRP